MSRRLLGVKLLWLAVPVAAACAWVAWSHRPMPPPTSLICNIGADSVPHTPGEAVALEDARRSEGRCDGQSMECRFHIYGDGANIGITVEHAAVDLLNRKCLRATDNQTHYTYSPLGAFLDKSGPNP